MQGGNAQCTSCIVQMQNAKCKINNPSVSVADSSLYTKEPCNAKFKIKFCRAGGLLPPSNGTPEQIQNAKCKI